MSTTGLALHMPDIPRRMKGYVRRETKTDKKSLEERRDRLQVRIGKMWEMLEVLQSDRTSEEEKAKVLNLCSTFGMVSLIEAVAFVGDSLTSRVILKTKDSTGKKQKVPVRYSVGMTLEDIAGATIDVAELSGAVARIARDIMMLKLGAKSEEMWRDENNLLRCPHLTDHEEEAGDDLTEEENKAIEEQDKEREERIRAEEDDLLTRLKAQYAPRGTEARPEPEVEAQS